MEPKRQHELSIYLLYHNRLADYKLVKPDPNINDLVDKVMKAYNLEVCRCCFENLYINNNKTSICRRCTDYDPMFCVKCNTYSRIDNITYENGESICKECKHLKPNMGKIIQDLGGVLEHITGYSINKCVGEGCEKMYVVKYRHLKKLYSNHRDYDNVTKYEYERRAPIPNSSERLGKFYQMCWDCQEAAIKPLCEKTEECSFCRDFVRPTEVVKCDQGCCQYCEYCRVVCNKCNTHQCLITKTCGPMFHNSGRMCKKCHIFKSVSTYETSRGEPIRNYDKCPHPWCLACEKCYGATDHKKLGCENDSRPLHFRVVLNNSFNRGPTNWETLEEAFQQYGDHIWEVDGEKRHWVKNDNYEWVICPQVEDEK